MKKIKKPLIEIVATVKGASLLEDIVPKSTKNYVPQWFKNMPMFEGSVKMCPSFPDYFSQGFVLPMWMDSRLIYNHQTGEATSQSSEMFPPWRDHKDTQFLNHVNVKTMLKDKVKHIYMTTAPWRVYTPPGYSVMQLPFIYDFDSEFSVLPGIIDTDIYHEVNPQILYTSSKSEIIIKRGTPLAIYFPFKRTNYKIEAREMDSRDEDYIRKEGLMFTSHFLGSGLYRKMQRQRDKKNN